MKTGGGLAVYAAGAVVVFAGAFAAAAAVVPDGAVTAWKRSSGMGAEEMNEESMGSSTAARGVALSQDGYLLSPVSAPAVVGQTGVLRFKVLGRDGEPVVKYQVSHEMELHLIVVRSDGSEFRHVHPTLNRSTGTWSLPWAWDEAGTYRVFADFVPAAEGADDVTLTRTVQVGGDFTPLPDTGTKTVDEVAGFRVSVAGDLTAGSASDLTLTVTRDGEPVTTLQPYLGAFGHLVALREGDLAYLHVHPMGEEPKAGDTSGPSVSFMTEAPTVGRYRLYLDFQVNGEVHTAEFVLDAERGAPTATAGDSGH